MGNKCCREGSEGYLRQSSDMSEASAPSLTADEWVHVPASVPAIIGFSSGFLEEIIEEKSETRADAKQSAYVGTAVQACGARTSLHDDVKFSAAYNESVCLSTAVGACSKMRISDDDGKASRACKKTVSLDLALEACSSRNVSEKSRTSESESKESYVMKLSSATDFRTLTTEARTRIDSGEDMTDWMTNMSSIIYVKPFLLRGVHPFTLLENYGGVIRSGPITDEEEGELGFGLSFEVETLVTFLSHSWHANSLIKTLALHSYFNRTAASIAGALAAFGCTVLIAAGYLPHWSEEIPGTFYREMVNPKFTSRVSDSGWCVLAFLCAYVCTFLFWQRARLFLGKKCRRGYKRRHSMFLDKLCIHQTDPSRKREGIDAIGAYLMVSQQLLILWDKTYFSRLWCIFEVAVWSTCSFKANSKRQLLFFPSTALAIEPIISIVMSLIFVLLKVSLVYRVVNVIVTENTSAVSVWSTIYVFAFVAAAPLVWIGRKYLRDLRGALIALETFNIHDAKCASDDDRRFVFDTIIVLYGSLDAFQVYVRSKLSADVQLRLGGIGRIRIFSYWMLFRTVGLTLLVQFLGMDQVYVESSAFRSWLEFVFFNCVAWLIILLCELRIFLRCLLIRIDTDKRRQEIVICLFCSSLLSCGAVIAHSSLIAFLKEDVLPKLAYGSLACLLCVGECATHWAHA